MIETVHATKLNSCIEKAILQINDLDIDVITKGIIIKLAIDSFQTVETNLISRDILYFIYSSIIKFQNKMKNYGISIDYIDMATNVFIKQFRTIKSVDEYHIKILSDIKRPLSTRRLSS